MSSIILSKDIGSLFVECEKGTICVYHKSYQTPVLPDDVRCVEFSVFEKNPRRYMEGIPSLVFVGLNKAMTPSTRTHDVFEVLFNNSKDLKKISVDKTLFVSEPWRAWFHFGLVGARYREYTYSYLAESRWNSYVDRVIEADPFSIDEIRKYGKGKIRSMYDRYFDSIRINVENVSDSFHEKYQEEKRRAFDEEHTLFAITRRLESVAKEAFPKRKIPNKTTLFSKDSHEIFVTDLPIDTFLVRKITDIANLTNEIGNSFNDNC